MRKFFITTALIVLVNILWAQSYEKLVDTNKMWVTWVGDSGNPELGHTEAYKFADSVLIDGDYWYTIQYAQDHDYQDWADHYSDYFYREVDQKVYVKMYDSVYILYDFGVEVGDTIRFANYETGYVIDSIKTEFFAGKDRLRYYYNKPGGISGSYYGGVGSYYGLLYPLEMEIVGAYYQFVCYFDDGELLYHNQEYDTCYLNVTGVEETEGAVFSVYPNPAREYICFDIPGNNTIGQFELYDIQGRKMLVQSIENKQHLSIETLNDGLYLYNLHIDGKRQTGKLIIE